MRRITNLRLPNPQSDSSLNKFWWIELDDQNCIKTIHPINNGTAIGGENWEGDWISPMGIDLQINGGLGLSFSELTKEDLPKLNTLMRRLWIDGIEAICPTIITCELKSLRNSLEVIHKARKTGEQKTCKLLGAHLEGPFISAKRPGVHPLEYICKPSYEALYQRIQGYEDEISLVTLAPELQGSEKLIKTLKKLGIVICLGHSCANSLTSQRAFNQGIEMLTHTFNAMPGLHKREPGPIGEALMHGEIALGLIADGIHVDPKIAVMLLRLAPKQIVLVSDALSPYGLKDGTFQWAKKDLLVKSGTCRLDDGRLAGVTLPLLETCQRLAQWSHEPSKAIWAATVAPRKVLNKETTLAHHLLGKPLNQLLRWHQNYNDKKLYWQFAA